jgi:WD40 repeat protein
VTSVAFSADGERIATGGGEAMHMQGNEAQIWGARTGKLLLDLTQPHPETLWTAGARVNVAFSPDGKRIIVAGARTMTSLGDKLTVHDAQTGAALLELKVIEAVLSAAFNKDGSRIVTGNFNDTATVWDAQTGKSLVELKGHTGLVNSVAFSPDGKRVVTGSSDRTVRVWDVRTGATVAVLKGHTDEVRSVSFSADGTRILSAGGLQPDRPGEVFVWDARTVKEPPDEDEIAYRRLHMQSNPWHYRANYLAARAAKDDFAAAFYLNLIPPDERKGALDQAEADAFAALSKLAGEQERAGKLEEAVTLYIEVLNYHKAKLGPEDPATIQTAETLGRISLRMSGLGRAYLAEKKWSEAEPLLRKCVAIWQKNQPDHWTTFDVQSMLGASLMGQKKYAEAEPLLRKGYEGLKEREKSLEPRDAPRVVEALDRLIELYTALNKPDEAKKWQAERVKYPQGKTKKPETSEH